MAVDLDGRVVDIDEHQVVDRSPQGLTRETGQHPAGYGIEQVGRDQRCGPQGRTQRRGCIGAVEDRADRPCRSRAMSSMLSAPATIPATSEVTLRPEFAALSLGTLRC